MKNDSSPMLGAMGLCRKAGKLLNGYDRVQEAVMRGKVFLVLLAKDTSPRTAQHMRAVCEDYVPCKTMPLTTAELAPLTAKPSAVFAVTDENFARLCAKQLTQNKEDTANGL